MDDFDEKYEELVEKVRLIEEQLEEIEEEDDPGLIDAGSCQVTLENTQFSAHWVSPEDAKSFEDCDAVTNTRDAQKLFKEASAFRDASDKHRSVEHGDLMVLTCNRGEEIPIIVDGVEVVDTAAERETNACYFIGMCIRPDGSFQEECPAGSDVTNKQNPCGDSEDPDAETFKEFIAWDTCGSGSSCEVEYDEDGNPLPAKNVEITEVTNPDSVEQADTLLKEYSQTTDSPEKLADVVTGITVVDEEESEEAGEEVNLLIGADYTIVNDEDATNPIALPIPHRDVSTVTQKSVSTSLDLKELTVTQKVTTLAKKIINKTKLPFKKIKLSSDECGNLTREPDPDEGSYDPDSEQDVLVNVDSSEVGSLEIQSSSISLGAESSDEGFAIDSTKIDLGSVMTGGYDPSQMNYILPNLLTSESARISRNEYITFVKALSLKEVTVDKETDSANNIVTIKLEVEKSGLNFASGLFLDEADPLSPEELTITFNIPKAELDAPTHDIQVCDEEGVIKTLKVYVKEEEE